MGISPKTKGTKRIRRMVLFPVIVLAVYGILFTVVPDKATLAMQSSGKIFLNVALPLGLVFAVMLVFNLFIKPAQVVKLFGKSTGLKATILSVAGGIISMGPIYVWYPFLKDLREKGAQSSPIAVFLYARAIKPFLLPVMVSYFGWIYVVILTSLTALGSIAVGYLIRVFMRDDKP